MNERQLRQDALAWFTKQYGNFPQNLGYDAVVLRTKRLPFFAKIPQVVFAPNQKTATAFIKAQTILERIFNGTIIFILYVAVLLIGVLIFLSRNTEYVAFLVMLILSSCFLVFMIVIICCFKVKPLEIIYQDKIITYTA